MRLSEAVKVLKENTMACWWPSRAMGRQGTDWYGIKSEVGLLLLGIKRRQGIEDEAKFFILDEDNPETALYDRLVEATFTVICGVKVGIERRVV